MRKIKTVIGTQKNFQFQWTQITTSRVLMYLHYVNDSVNENRKGQQKRESFWSKPINGGFHHDTCISEIKFSLIMFPNTPTYYKEQEHTCSEIGLLTTDFIGSSFQIGDVKRWTFD